MIDDEKIIEMFFERSEQGIRELDIKYGKVFHNLSYHIVRKCVDIALKAEQPELTQNRTKRHEQER